MTLLRGVFAGWLIALMVWLMPFAEQARVWVIVVITYFVGLGRFRARHRRLARGVHLGRGRGRQRGTAFASFGVPCLIGNVFGGTLLVAVLNHAQVVSGSDSERV